MADNDPIEGAYATIADLKAIWPGLPSERETEARELLIDAAVRIDAYASPSSPLTDPQKRTRKTVSREMVKWVMASDQGAVAGGAESRPRPLT